MSFLRTLGAVLLLALLAPVAAAADPSPRDLLAAGRVDDVISTLTGRIQASANDAEAYHLLGRAYFALGDWDRAVSFSEKAVALAPNNSDYHLWLGRAYGEKADHSSFLTAAGLAKKVRGAFERAVALNPASVAARTDLAEFYLEAPGIVGGGQDKARAQAQTLASLAPPKAHWVSARIAEKNKDLATAEKEYRAAIQASEGRAEAWFNLALFYRHVGRLDDLEQTVNRVASAPMDKPEVLVDSAEILLRSGRNFPGAIQLLRRYLSSSSTVEEAPAFKAHYLLGMLLEKQGDRQAAAQEYQAALALAKGFAQAKEALSRVGR